MQNTMCARTATRPTSTRVLTVHAPSPPVFSRYLSVSLLGVMSRCSASRAAAAQSAPLRLLLAAQKAKPDGASAGWPKAKPPLAVALGARFSSSSSSSPK